MLAAVQLLPTMEWAGLLDRSLGMRWDPLPLSGILGLLSRDLLHNPNVDGVHVPEGACYIGAFAAALLPFLVFWKKRRDVLFFGLLAFFCLEVAYGLEPGFWISQHTPVLAGLPNWRFLAVADFAFAVLAGFAISALESRCVSVELSRQSSIAWLLSGAAAGAALVLRIAGVTLISVRLNLVLVLLSLAIALLAALRRIPASDFLRAAAIVIFADLTAAGFAYVPFVKAADIFPRAPVFEYLTPKASPLWRVAGVDGVYAYQFDMPYGLSAASGYDFLTRRTKRILSIFKTESSFQSTALLAAPKGALDLTGTRYFITTDWNPSTDRFAALPERFHKIYSVGHIQVFENPDAAPLLSFLPSGAARVFESEDEQFRAITAANFDSSRSLVLAQKVDRFWGNRGNPAARSIAGVIVANDEVKLTVSADQDGLVYFNESWYPGWIAEVDGAKAPVIRANYNFMAVPVAAGSHTVSFEFASQSFRIGAALSLMAVVLVAISMGVPFLRRSGR
jgi:Bacterial membrane protein YfhO